MWPKPHKDPASPQIEYFFCSKSRSIASLAVGLFVFCAAAEYFLRPGPNQWLAAALCAILIALSGYAVFCELRSLLNPKAHCLATGPDGLSIATTGKPVLYPWSDITGFEISNELEHYSSERLSKLRGRYVKIELRDARKVSVDDTYGWNKPEDLAAYLHQKKRQFSKRKPSKETDDRR